MNLVHGRAVKQGSQINIWGYLPLFIENYALSIFKDFDVVTSSVTEFISQCFSLRVSATYI